MKIVWVCNVMPMQAAKALDLPQKNVGGWIRVLSERLAEKEGIELMILFPVSRTEKNISGEAYGIRYAGFPMNVKAVEKYEKRQEAVFRETLKAVCPDVIHIWGSEFPHCLAMLRVCEEASLLSRTVISIQGLISIYAKHYCAGLPERVIKGMSLRDFLRHDNIREAQKKFEYRGEYEKEALKIARHVIGRTEWDLACTKRMNARLQYHRANEILREEFYEGSWRVETCDRHRVFMSQWGYPIKGFHQMLAALREVVESYPDTILYITGQDPFQAQGRDRVKQSYYVHYIMTLLTRWNLRKHVVFMGRELNAEEMKEQYVKAHVFVLPSVIENSPNSLGEAMLLGTPVVCADTGGMNTMLRHGTEGFLYPFDEPYMLAHYIKKIFSDDKLAGQMSEAEKKRAAETHDIESNVAAYLEIYETLSSGE